MKHPDLITADDVLQALAAAGVAADQGQAGLIARHSNAVLTTNLTMNLTRVTERADVLCLHIEDSASALDVVHSAPAGRIADIGSGAGYPGVILSILTGRDTTLVESIQKKANFLTAIAAELALSVDVVADRAEHLALTGAEEYAVVVARALASLPALVELSAPLLCMGGRLVAMKGPIEVDEIARGDKAATTCGLERSALKRFELSNGDRRTIMCYTKVGKPRVRLPRRSGMAQRSPLA